VVKSRDVLILICIPGIGTHRLRALVRQFHDLSEISLATAQELARVEGIDRKTALAITGFFRGEGSRSAERFADDQLQRARRTGGAVVTYWDDDYPASLKKIYDPPPFLFFRGDLKPIDNSSIAIVGTRAPSQYGTSIAGRFASDLARRGLTVVSGLARGIDTIAHASALDSGGRTLAVIGSGIDVIYPSENSRLAGRITASGAIISEYPMGSKPDAMNFPRRNRIISGIALGTLIIETGVEGGAMITASTALDQNREVFAVPSPLQERKTSGTNRLIKEGKALLTESVDDILTELGPRLKGILTADKLPSPAPPPELTLFEQRVHDVLEETPLHIDQLAERAGLSTGDALVHLLSLEFKGLVRQMAGKLFVRI
jgi:DNA processing protein